MKTLKDIVPEDLQGRIKEDNEKAKYTDQNNLHPDITLFTEWAYRVEKGWYGFALDDSVPYSWTIAIDLVLDYIAEQIPDFKIQQIKLKFGGLRFYVDLKMEECELIKEINSIIAELEALCFSRGLIF